MIEIKNRYTGDVIYSGDFKLIKNCLLDAIESGANLRGADLGDADLGDADLRGAYLRDADLHGADLRDADLHGADLRGADLHGADLHGANLRDADLHGADLHGANLRDAYLWNCIGNRYEIRSLFISEVYPITYTSNTMQIGCERHKISDWWEFDDERILKMDGKSALKFWRKNKELIKLCIDTNPATPAGKE